LNVESNSLRDDGSTASTAVLIGRHLYVANVGDSRAVMSKARKGRFYFSNIIDRNFLLFSDTCLTFTQLERDPDVACYFVKYWLKCVDLLLLWIRYIAFSVSLTNGTPKKEIQV